MNRIILFIGVLTLAALACVATDNAPPLVENNFTTRGTVKRDAPEPERELYPRLDKVSAPEPEREICHVRTNVNSGVLNLRSCAGVSCSVIGYLFEGEPLSVLEPGAWIKVETVTNETGYVNSAYCKNGE